MLIHRFTIRSTPQGGIAHRMSSLRCAIRSIFDNKGVKAGALHLIASETNC